MSTRAKRGFNPSEDMKNCYGVDCAFGSCPLDPKACRICPGNSGDTCGRKNFVNNVSDNSYNHVILDSLFCKFIKRNAPRPPGNVHNAMRIIYRLHE
jgi:hypothetical protein